MSDSQTLVKLGTSVLTGVIAPLNRAHIVEPVCQCVRVPHAAGHRIVIVTLARFWRDCRRGRNISATLKPLSATIAS